MAYAAWVILGGWMGMVLLMAALFLWCRHGRHVGVVDAVWALGVGGLALYYAALMPGDGLLRGLLVLFAGVWALRLGGHILVDRVLGKPEDGRYQDINAGWGADAPRRLFRFFQYQAFFALVFSLPFVPLAMGRERPHPAQVLFALLVWAVAIGGETLADAQLSRWRRDPANHGQTCRKGLWRYSRHPNYFFEWVYWWTYVLLGIHVAAGWLTLLGPLLMFLFLYRVTGIPYTEKQALKTRGDDYRRYQAEVNAFFPWRPRRQRRGRQPEKHRCC